MNNKAKEKLVINQDSLKSLVRRFQAPSPTFFKKVAKILVLVGAVSASVVTAAAGGMVLPPILISLAGYGAVAGLTGAALAKLPVDWDKVKEDEASNKNN